jgi:hypothetical protein
MSPVLVLSMLDVKCVERGVSGRVTVGLLTTLVKFDSCRCHNNAVRTACLSVYQSSLSAFAQSLVQLDLGPFSAFVQLELEQVSGHEVAPKCRIKSFGRTRRRQMKVGY